MILESARAAAGHLFWPEFRSVLWKSIGLTVLLFAGVWFGLRELFEILAWPFVDQMMPDLPSWAGWIGFIAGILASLGLALGLALLIAPVTAIVAGLLLDDVAEVVEKEDDPLDPKGKPLPAWRSFILSGKVSGCRHRRQFHCIASAADPWRQHRRVLHGERLFAGPRILGICCYAIPP